MHHLLQSDRAVEFVPAVVPDVVEGDLLAEDIYIYIYTYMYNFTLFMKE